MSPLPVGKLMSNEISFCNLDLTKKKIFISFGQSGQLKVHLRIKHHDQGLYDCPKCAEVRIKLANS